MANEVIRDKSRCSECLSNNSKNGRFVLSSKCAVCGSKKSKFMKE